MTRKVVIAKKLAEHVLDLKRKAKESGRQAAFRQAWATIWNALHERPLPPEEADAVFGEPLYRTRHSPVHLVCLGCARPLAAHFATCDVTVLVAGQPTSPVFMLSVSLMAVAPTAS